MRYLVIILLVLGISCAKVDGPKADLPTILLSKISIENGAFVKADGDTFFPWGFNYTNAKDVGLIEDHWMDDEVWAIIKSDFTEMKSLGANVVRIHLQYNRFMLDATTPNEKALERLNELAEFAHQTELYLDVTGLAAYRTSDQPSFYTSMSDEERWATQKLFWQHISERLEGNTAIFTYNLMNEPVVSVGCNPDSDCNWVPGDGLGGFNFVQNITRTPGNDFASTLKDWMGEMSEAIRSQDDEALITVGFLSLGSYNQFETDLDFLSPHVYPISGEIDKAVDRILGNLSDVPVVIEETSNFKCSVVELRDFLNRIDGHYAGMLGHYHGETYEDLVDDSIPNALRRNFLKFFIDNNPN